MIPAISLVAPLLTVTRITSALANATAVSAVAESSPGPSNRSRPSRSVMCNPPVRSAAWMRGRASRITCRPANARQPPT